MNSQEEDREIFVSHCFEPFPEPQTIPSGWDLSGLLSAPKLAPVEEADPGTDNETDQPLDSITYI